MSAYVLKASLAGSRKPVWRRLRVPGDATLGELAEVLLIAFDVSESGHELQVGKKTYGPLDESSPKTLDEDTITLEAVARDHDALTYVGDAKLEIAIEKTVKQPTALECLGGEPEFDLATVNEALVEWVVSHAAPMSDKAEVEELTKTLDAALRKDPEAMVTVRARVVANLIRDLLTGAIDLGKPE